MNAEEIRALPLEDVVQRHDRLDEADPLLQRSLRELAAHSAWPPLADWMSPIPVEVGA